MSSLGEVVKHRRVSIPLTLSELSHSSGVSASHLARIEYGERFPSARVLRKIAKYLGLKEKDLFKVAGFLSDPYGKKDSINGIKHARMLDPYVAQALASEPVEIQRVVIGILNLLKMLLKQKSYRLDKFSWTPI